MIYGPAMIIVLFPRDAICLVSRGGVGGLLGCLVDGYGAEEGGRGWSDAGIRA